MRLTFFPPETKSISDAPKGCTTKSGAADAADKANKLMHGDPPDYERTHVLFSDEEKGIGVGLIFRADGQSGRAASFTVGPDCQIVGIN